MANDNHSFSVEDAKKYGVEKALIINHFKFFLKCHQSNGTHKYDGYVWAYNSAKSLNELMPYLNIKSISRWLVELERDGVLISGNYNKIGIDKTKWYTMSEFAISQSEVSNSQNITSISQNEVSSPQNEEALPIQSTIQSTSKSNSTRKNFEVPSYERLWDIPVPEAFKEKIKNRADVENILAAISEKWDTFCRVRYTAHNKRYHSDISEAQALADFLRQCKSLEHAMKSLDAMIGREAINPFVIDLPKGKELKLNHYGVDASRFG